MKKLVVFLFILAAPLAQAADMIVTGGIVSSSPKFESSAITGGTVKAGTAWDAGVLFHLPAGARMKVETGAVYLNRSYKGDGTMAVFGAVSTEQKLTGIHVPLLARFYLTQGLSLGVGGYYERGIGKVKNTLTALGTTTTTESTYSQKVYHFNHFGLEAALGYEFPMSGKMGFMLDARYIYGLTNLDYDTVTPGTTKFRDMVGNVGFVFHM